MDLSSFESNVEASEDGVWNDLSEDSRIKVARYGNKKFNKLLQAKMSPYKRLIDQNRLDDDISEKILNEAIVGGILLDWEGLTYQGEPLSYSRENAMMVLSDKRLKDFRDYIVTIAQDAELFRAEQIDETVEKSLTV